MISILLPIYNGIEFIEESIYSILQQEYTDWELLIGINGYPVIIIEALFAGAFNQRIYFWL